VSAHALGLTGVHINRVLRDLRERGLLTLKRGNAVIHDATALKNTKYRIGGRRLVAFRGPSVDGFNVRQFCRVVDN
jgi:Crp-like helix-turn-helix domain